MGMEQFRLLVHYSGVKKCCRLCRLYADRPYSTLVSGKHSQLGIIHDVLRLNWKENSDLPVIELAARLEPDNRYLEDDSFADYHLVGRYFVVDTLEYLLIWNWKENSVGVLDGEECNWSNRLGFILAVVPPNIFVIPQDQQRILTIDIPHLHPVGSPESYKFIRPAYMSDSFLDNLTETLHMNIFPLNSWRPPSPHNASALVRTLPHNKPSLFYLLSLHRTGAAPLTLPLPIRVNTLPSNFDWDNPTNITVFPGIGLLTLSWPDFEDHRLYLSLSPFTEDGNIETAINREFAVAFPCEGKPGQLDMISGSLILRCCGEGEEPYTHVVGVVSFD
ncbi:hypothetical protein DL93DRAFT_1982036 [Clavulina sp. PMI_390]|nr:hypothetical protein DL93DRAFT_1982036 [Clavulina sp. PMI_390]